MVSTFPMEDANKHFASVTGERVNYGAGFWPECGLKSDTEKLKMEYLVSLAKPFPE